MDKTYNKNKNCNIITNNLIKKVYIIIYFKLNNI